jgi:hypothetical protein
MSEAPEFYRMSIGDGFGVAFSSPDVDSVSLIPDRGELTSWTPLELVIRPGEWEGPPGDYVNSDLIVRLCSKRLRHLLDNLRSEVDKVQWLPAYVTDMDGNRVEYFVLHFPEPPDVLDMDKSIFSKESAVLMRPALSRNKVGDHRLFNIPGLYIATVVHESVKNALEAESIQGIEFSRIRAW